jgi:acyl-CoA synthetase (AMP-forming)/AMP-acid ligase II
MLHDELYVIGRIKDIIINAGQNVFPEDIEAVVNTVSGIYPGRVVAFGVAHEEYGTEVIAVVAEMKGEYDAARAANLEQEIRGLLLAAIGIAPRYVSVVPERWIVKSTAGKISRHDTRLRFLREPYVAKPEIALPSAEGA